MKIIIKEESGVKPIKIRIPLGLAANSVTAALISKKSEELTYSQAVRLMRAVKKSAKLLDGMPLVELIEDGGDCVTIFL